KSLCIWAIPDHRGLVFGQEQIHGHQLDPEVPYGWQDAVRIEPQSVAAHTEHGGEGRTIDVRIDDTHAPTLQHHEHCQSRGDGTLAHATFAAHHGKSTLDSGHTGFEPGELLSHLPSDIGATIAGNISITLRHTLPRNAKRGTVSRAPR